MCVLNMYTNNRAYIHTCTSTQIFSLLSVGSFVTVVTQLLGGIRSESIDVQQKTIEIFNSKLESGKLKLQKDNVCYVIHV